MAFRGFEFCPGNLQSGVRNIFSRQLLRRQALQFFLTFNWKMRQDFIHSHVAEDPRE